MAADTAKSTAITNLDANPRQMQSAGQGASGALKVIDDVCACTATGIDTLASTYRLCRFPTGAIPKSVVIAADKILDSHNADTLVIDVNLAFSDSTVDGTPANVQGLIPTSANTGATTTVAAYSSPNLIFGQITPVYTVIYGPSDVIFNGSRTTYPMTTLTLQPLWQTFGFVDGRSNPADPNGFFDLLLYVSTAGTTGAAANIYGKVSYVY